MSGFSRAGHRVDPGPADFLPPEPVRRRNPGAPPASWLPRSGDVVDVEFEVIAAGRRPIQPVFNDNHPSSRVDAGRGKRPTGRMDSLEARLRGISTGRFALLTVSLCLLVFLIAGRLSAPAPQSLSALSFDAVTAGLADRDGMRVVAVYGAVVNRTDRPQNIPPIRVDLVSGTITSNARALLAGTGPITPGEVRRFSARLPHAGGPLPEAKISFVATDAPVR